MKKFNILLTVTTEKVLAVEAPDAETACQIAEIVGLSTNVLEDASDINRDAMAEILEEDDPVICCEGCDMYCPICEECTLPECKQNID